MSEVDLSEFAYKRHAKCRVAELKLDPEQRAKLDAACAHDSGITTYAIRLVLQRWKHPLASQTIQKHRDGECACAGTA